MLRVHFLNVGHGDCTVIEHPSGRLTMMDINTSQEYDNNSFKELLAGKNRSDTIRLPRHLELAVVLRVQRRMFFSD